MCWASVVPEGSGIISGKGQFTRNVVTLWPFRQFTTALTSRRASFGEHEYANERRAGRRSDRRTVMDGEAIMKNEILRLQFIHLFGESSADIRPQWWTDVYPRAKRKGFGNINNALIIIFISQRQWHWDGFGDANFLLMTNAPVPRMANMLNLWMRHIESRKCF